MNKYKITIWMPGHLEESQPMEKYVAVRMFDDMVNMRKAGKSISILGRYGVPIFNIGADQVVTIRLDRTQGCRWELVAIG